MKEFTHVVADPMGIHARPAGVLVKKAASFASTVTLRKGEKTADVKRLFALMGLGTRQGDTVTLLVDGPDEEAAMDALSTMLRENF